MKLLLSLLLILSITIGCIQSIYIDKSKVELKTQKCFNDLDSFTGFSTTYTRIGMNLVHSDFSVYEEGTINYDYNNKMFFSNYSALVNNHQTSTEIIGFGSNNTQYVIYDEGDCYYLNAEFPLIQQFVYKYIGDINMGTVPCEMYASLSNNLVAETLVLANKNDCSFMGVAVFEDNSNGVKGHSMTNFYNYQASNPVQLPSTCYNATLIPNTSNNKIRSLFN